MDEELIVDLKFQKGFNDGYKLAEHEPELAMQVAINKNDHNEYFSGLVSGKEQHDMEKTQERMHGVNRNEIHPKDIDKNRGKDK